METNILNLHTEIALDIFTRLPAESVLQCRRVCRTWRKILLHEVVTNKFADMHLRSQFLHRGFSFSNGVGAAKVGLGLLFLIESDNKNLLVYGEYDENSTIIYEYDDDEQINPNINPYKILRMINHRPIKKRLIKSPTSDSLVGSCNGLICISEPQGYSEADPVHICNPITGEYVDLPRLNDYVQYKFIDKIIGGFGYVASTDEYKVVRIYYRRDDEPSKGYVQVYTLGSGNGWRNVEEMTEYSFLDCSPTAGILANGALHWLSSSGNVVVILAFDLASEKFHVVELPPCVHHYDDFDILVLGGWLSVAKRKTEQLDKSFLKKTNNTETMTYDIKETDEYYQSWSWNKEFTIEWGPWNRALDHPFGLTKSGEVLLWGGETLFHYDPKIETEIELGNMKFIEAILHMNSFVSLEAIGEKCRKRRRCTLKTNSAVYSIKYEPFSFV